MKKLKLETRFCDNKADESHPCQAPPWVIETSRQAYTKVSRGVLQPFRITGGTRRCLGFGVFQAITCELPAVIYSQPPLSASSTPSVSNFITHQFLAPLAAISTSLLLPIISYSYLLLFTISFYYSQPLSSIFPVLSVIYYQLLSIICQVLRSTATFYSLLFIVTYHPSASIYYFTSIHCHLAVILPLPSLPKFTCSN